MIVPMLLVVSVGAVLGIGGGIALVAWTERHPSFKAVFFFKPSKKGSRLRPTEQRAVEKKLSRLAEHFAAHDKAERTIEVEPPTSSDFEKWQKEQRKRLANARRELEAAKMDFWRAHGLAAKEGFRVRQRYIDYLPR